MPLLKTSVADAVARPLRLGVDWEPRRAAFLGSLSALAHGPVPPKGWPVGQYFRDSWVRSRFPARAFIASVLWHIVLFNYPFPTWLESNPKPRLAVPRIEVTWYGPVVDLPPLLAPRKPRESPPRARQGADAFHPRQTIVSAPLRPTHPRQTLIRPAAPPEPPKILPQLPNIVQWSESPRPAKLRLQLSPQALARLRPKTRAARAPADLPVPEMPNLEKRAGELSIASSQMTVPRPRLPVTPSVVPSPGPRTAAPEAAPAPDIDPAALGSATGVGLDRLVALSAAPAAPAPLPPIPPGNLAASFSVSPEGTPAGAPSSGTATSGGSGGLTAVGGYGTGPAEVSITGGNPNAVSNVSGPAGGTVSARPLASGLGSFPAKPEPRASPASPDHTRPAPALDRIKPGAPPEELLGPKRYYTLHVNMPNLASATGSWVLSFAELNEDAEEPSRRDGAASDLVGPVPLRKVDPKYPPALMSARVQGEVVLYAIIRKDGSVDSIQLVKSLEPQLDQNSMEALARWRFRPAERKGGPVELEAVVHIPFRFAAPY